MYVCLYFFFSDPATTEIYTYCHTLSLLDSLSSCSACRCSDNRRFRRGRRVRAATSMRRLAASAGTTSSVSTCHTAAERQAGRARTTARSEEHTSELQSLMCTSYAVFCLKKKINTA